MCNEVRKDIRTVRRGCKGKRKEKEREKSGKRNFVAHVRFDREWSRRCGLGAGVKGGGGTRRLRDSVMKTSELSEGKWAGSVQGQRFLTRWYLDGWTWSGLLRNCVIINFEWRVEFHVSIESNGLKEGKRTSGCAVVVGGAARCCELLLFYHRSNVGGVESRSVIDTLYIHS